MISYIEITPERDIDIVCREKTTTMYDQLCGTNSIVIMHRVYGEWEILPRCVTQRPSTRDLRLLQIWGFVLFDSIKIDGFIWASSGSQLSAHLVGS
jgi:hypothetical protein